MGTSGGSALELLIGRKTVETNSGSPGPIRPSRPFVCRIPEVVSGRDARWKKSRTENLREQTVAILRDDTGLSDRIASTSRAQAKGCRVKLIHVYLGKGKERIGADHKGGPYCALFV